MAPPTKTKQWTTGQDGLENLKMREADLPSLKEGEVLVKISAVSLNYRDTEGTWHKAVNLIETKGLLMEAFADGVWGRMRGLPR